jgi:hypothetical protein
MPLPFGPLRFLYVGSSDVGRDVAAYKTMGAEGLWDKTAFGTRVAAVRTAPPPAPLVLLAGHRPAGSILPIVQVARLKDAIKALRSAGWTVEGAPFEVPNGPCRLVKDLSGAEYALLEETRPDPFGPGSTT